MGEDKPLVEFSVATANAKFPGISEYVKGNLPQATSIMLLKATAHAASQAELRDGLLPSLPLWIECLKKMLQKFVDAQKDAKPGDTLNGEFQFIFAIIFELTNGENAYHRIVDSGVLDLCLFIVPMIKDDQTGRLMLALMRQMMRITSDEKVVRLFVYEKDGLNVLKTIMENAQFGHVSVEMTMTFWKQAVQALLEMSHNLIQDVEKQKSDPELTIIKIGDHEMSLGLRDKLINSGVFTPLLEKAFDLDYWAHFRAKLPPDSQTYQLYEADVSLVQGNSSHVLIMLLGLVRDQPVSQFHVEVDEETHHLKVKYKNQQHQLLMEEATKHMERVLNYIVDLNIAEPVADLLSYRVTSRAEVAQAVCILNHVLAPWFPYLFRPRDDPNSKDGVHLFTRPKRALSKKEFAQTYINSLVSMMDKYQDHRLMFAALGIAGIVSEEFYLDGVISSNIFNVMWTHCTAESPDYLDLFSQIFIACANTKSLAEAMSYHSNIIPVLIKLVAPEGKIHLWRQKDAEKAKKSGGQDEWWLSALPYYFWMALSTLSVTLDSVDILFDTGAVVLFQDAFNGNFVKLPGLSEDAYEFLAINGAIALAVVAQKAGREHLVPQISDKMSKTLIKWAKDSSEKGSASYHTIQYDVFEVISSLSALLKNRQNIQKLLPALPHVLKGLLRLNKQVKSGELREASYNTIECGVYYLTFLLDLTRDKQALGKLIEVEKNVETLFDETLDSLKNLQNVSSQAFMYIQKIKDLVEAVSLRLEDERDLMSARLKDEDFRKKLRYSSRIEMDVVLNSEDFAKYIEKDLEFKPDV